MKQARSLIFFCGCLLVLLATGAHGQTLSVCDYEPPQSHVSDLRWQGSFSWYDGPYLDDRNRSVSASLIVDYTGLTSSAMLGRSVDARSELRGTNDQWTADVRGSGSLQSYLQTDLFGVGVIGLDASTRSGLELDLTGGAGVGRFRDVNPLARAIRIQNDLLDVGALLAPLDDQTLMDLAQVLGEVGPTDEEKMVGLVARLTSTGLVAGSELNVRGLLATENALQSGDSRLCGHDVQLRLGVSAMVLPALRVASTGVVLVRYAAVPDPVSQFNSSAQMKIRLSALEQISLDADLSYVRRLPDGWTARGESQLSIDRRWTDPEASSIFCSAAGSLNTKIFGSLGLSVVGSAQYRTGDEEVTFSLAVYLEADVL